MKMILLKKAMTDITRRKLRSILVILGIMFGVASLTAINVANQSVYDAMMYSSNEAHAPNITIFAKSLTPADLAAVQQIANIKDAQLAYTYSTQWRAATGNNVALKITTYQDLHHILMNPFQVTKGQLPVDGQIALESSDAGLIPFALHDHIMVASPHNSLVPLEVSGTTRTLYQQSAVMMNAASGYMSADGFFALTGILQPNVLYAAVSDDHRLNETASQVNALLEARHVNITSLNYQDNSFDPGPLPGIFSILRVISLIALLVTAFLIMNTISILILEQTPIVGIMKAIGGTRSIIMLGYLFTVLIYAIIGTVLGLLLGIWGGYAFTALIATFIILDLGPFHIAAASLFIAALVGILTPVLSAIVPLFSGTAITARAAILQFANTEIAEGHSKIAAATRRLPQTLRLGFLSVLRRKGRLILTLIVLGISGAAFFMVQTASSSIDASMQRLFSTYNFDAFLRVNTEQPIASMKQTLATIPNFARVEPYEIDEVPSKWGFIRIEGRQYNTQIFHYQLINGSWFTSDDASSAVIGDTLAHKTHLVVGDTITTTVLNHAQKWVIIGIVHDYNGSLGIAGTMFVTYTGLAKFNHHDPALSGSFVLQTQDRSPSAVRTFVQSINNRLNDEGLNPNTTSVQQEIQRNNSQFQTLWTILYGAAAIIAMVGVLGLANTLATSVIDRRREIGIMRTLGGKGRQIAVVFMTEGLFLALLGWMIGITLGAAGAPLFVSFIGNALSLSVELTYSPWAIGIALVAVLVVGCIAAIGPAITASRLRIAEILRYE